MNQSYPVMEAPKSATDTVAGIPVAYLPPDWAVKSLEDIAGKHAPRYPEGTVSLHDIESLTDYIGRYSGHTSVIYVDSKKQSITAILDDGVPAPDGETEPVQGRRVNRAALTVSLDPKFQAWKSFAAQPRSQKDLVRFIEQNDSHFHKPDGAAMRTLAAQLDLKKTTKFSSIEKIAGAARDVMLGYETSTQEQGEVKFPSEVIIKIPVFEHQSRGEMPVRIYFDLVEGSVQFTLRIPDETAIIEAAWEEVKKQLAESLKEKHLDLPVLNGTAPLPPNS